MTRACLHICSSSRRLLSQPPPANAPAAGVLLLRFGSHAAIILMILQRIYGIVQSSGVPISAQTPPVHLTVLLYVNICLTVLVHVPFVR